MICLCRFCDVFTGDMNLLQTLITGCETSKGAVRFTPESVYNWAHMFIFSFFGDHQLEPRSVTSMARHSMYGLYTYI